MLLSQLAKATGHTLVGEDREIANIEYDSRKVHEGDLFCCVTGTFSMGMNTRQWQRKQARRRW